MTVSVGHCHPMVTKAIIEQTQRLQHTTTIYLNNQIAQYAKELTDRMPGNLKVRLEDRQLRSWRSPVSSRCLGAVS